MTLVLLLTTLLAFAGDGPTWAGVPLERLDDVGLGAPTLTDGEDSWRAPLPAGGYAHLWILPDEATAQKTFDWKARSAMTRQPESLETTRDQAVGDGTNLVLLREGNVVLLVRDHGLQAGKIADRILAELVVTAPVVIPGPGSVVVEGRDACGRLGK
jgi:hypothetical protein